MKQHNDWRTIPVLPCISITDTLFFWQTLGFEITYKQTRPYQYGIVERNGHALHFAGRKGMDITNNLSTCLIIVPEIDKVYQALTQNLKEKLGSVPRSGIPRISQMKPGATRFTLTDVSGNAVIFINDGKQDQETWEKAENKNQSPLQRAIAVAVRFRDYKRDEKAAAATLDAALRKAENESQTDIAEALTLRIDLAISMNDLPRAEECKMLLMSIIWEGKSLTSQL